MTDNRNKNKAILKIMEEKEQKIICPICKKDLTAALRLLDMDFEEHMKVHFNELDSEIINCIGKYLDEVPAELRAIYVKREGVIRTLINYNYILKSQD